ncbi:DUF4233 domain-containing protein [Demequina soli]|uniref:DUF4233 domain-containing protein n=1 Tax=Demequina soli TaxID=1638987 RepID=UPI000782398E|nr:DUF4233 domain-containing protein [Demequina soli]
MTAQPQPQPTGARPQRSATLTFCQAVLGLQALAALFTLLALWGLDRAGEVDIPGAVLWGGGLLLIVGFGYAAGKQATRWGRWLGWALQVPMVLGWFLDSTIGVVGVCFLLTWIVGLRLGTRIDRERAERAAAEAPQAGGGEAVGGEPA